MCIRDSPPSRVSLLYVIKEWISREINPRQIKKLPLTAAFLASVIVTVKLFPVLISLWSCLLYTSLVKAEADAIITNYPDIAVEIVKNA